MVGGKKRFVGLCALCYVASALSTTTRGIPPCAPHICVGNLCFCSSLIFSFLGLVLGVKYTYFISRQKRML